MRIMHVWFHDCRSRAALWALGTATLFLGTLPLMGQDQSPVDHSEVRFELFGRSDVDRWPLAPQKGSGVVFDVGGDNVGQPEHNSADMENNSRPPWSPESAESPDVVPGRPVSMEQPSHGLDKLRRWVDWCDFGLVVRGYYLNDQRIAWSGVEDTFGAEGAFSPVLKRQCGPWLATVAGEFYLNEPFDRNILTDTPERASYLGNYRVDTFEISQLFLSVERDGFLFALGKLETPFGRTYFPLLTNARLDTPFIRTESIRWRETGVLLRYRPGLFVGDLALTNGGDDRDTNSSKALISRLGLEGDNWAVGASVKAQDGVGSEIEKEFNSHVGMDFMLRRGRFIFSGEVIYDEYGFRRPGFDPNRITWRKSIYYRDQNYRDGVPLTGVGYYLDLEYGGDCWFASANYGEFYPRPIGDPQHDVVNRRGIMKLAYQVAAGLSVYGACILETEGYIAQDGRPRRGIVGLVGLQYAL